MNLVCSRFLKPLKEFNTFFDKLDEFVPKRLIKSTLKNQNFKNRASSCFKLAQSRPRAKFHESGTFGG